MIKIINFRCKYIRVSSDFFLSTHYWRIWSFNRILTSSRCNSSVDTRNCLHLLKIVWVKVRKIFFQYLKNCSIHDHIQIIDNLICAYTIIVSKLIRHIYEMITSSMCTDNIKIIFSQSSWQEIHITFFQLQYKFLLLNIFFKSCFLINSEKFWGTCFFW